MKFSTSEQRLRRPEGCRRETPPPAPCSSPGPRAIGVRPAAELSFADRYGAGSRAATALRSASGGDRANGSVG